MDLIEMHQLHKQLRQSTNEQHVVAVTASQGSKQSYRPPAEPINMTGPQVMDYIGLLVTDRGVGHG